MANLRHVFAHVPPGIAAVSAIVDDAPVVLVASSFQVGISADPPLVLFAVQHTSTSWPKLKAAPSLGVSILAAGHGAAARQLSSTSAPDRFEGITTWTAGTGAHYVVGAAVHLECRVHATVRAGDHDVVLLDVDAARHYPEVEPLIWHGSGFRELSR